MKSTYKVINGIRHRLDGVTNRGYLVAPLHIGAVTTYGKVVKRQWTKLDDSWDNHCQ